MNDLFLRAVRCQPLPRPPIWLMRQAGRYIPQYRQLRQKYPFRTLITTPELAAEVTRLPLLFGDDAAILFSDILLVAEAFGFTIDFTEGGQTPAIRLIEPIREKEFEIESLASVGKTIALLKQDLSVPLIGFCGGPYTVAKYMGRITPPWIDQITSGSIAYLQMQIEAGVNAIQIFDSWAGFLSHAEFITLALPYLRRLVEGVKGSGVPMILFCRGSCRFLHELAGLEPSGISFDWDKEMKELRQATPTTIAVQGNLDPSILAGPLPHLQHHAAALLDSMQGSRGFIFNLGHGILPHTPVENVQWLVDYVTGR